MWSCSYCGNHLGMVFEDNQLSGVICMHPDCGRFEVLDREEIRRNPHLIPDSDF